MRNALLVAIGCAAVAIAGGSYLYARNATPVLPQISAADALAAGPPWVVKLHARWCPVCMLTKSVWDEVENHYAGRVRFAVFDFTNEATTAASRAEAERLGIVHVFEEAGFATGPVIVLDGQTKRIAAWIDGSRDFADYRMAIDAALAANDDR